MNEDEKRNLIYGGAASRLRTYDDRSELNDMLNSSPETQFLGNKPPPTPTPTPNPRAILGNLGLELGSQMRWNANEIEKIRQENNKLANAKGYLGVVDRPIGTTLLDRPQTAFGLMPVNEGSGKNRYAFFDYPKASAASLANPPRNLDYRQPRANDAVMRTSNQLPVGALELGMPAPRFDLLRDPYRSGNINPVFKFQSDEVAPEQPPSQNFQMNQNDLMDLGRKYGWDFR